MKHSKLKSLAAGFSLIELMIVVAIIAIIASIAYPSYQEQIAKGRRAEARAELAQAQQWMERFYGEHFSYSTATNGATMASQFATQGFVRAPREGTQMYSITVTATVSAYTLTATPLATSSMANDHCQTYTTVFTGRKTSTANDPARCLR